MELGVNDPTPDIRDYPRRPPTGDEFLKHFDEHLLRIKNWELAVGRIGTFKDPVYACHTGIIGMKSGQFTLIHASSTRAKVVEDFFYQQGWDTKRIALFEFPTFEEVPA